MKPSNIQPSRNTQLSACFFARVASPDVVERVEFYAQDVRALHDLGYDVRVVTRTRDLVTSKPADLYFVWWWTRALPAVALARALRKPVVITGTFDTPAWPLRPRWHRAEHRLSAQWASANVFVSELETRDVPALIPNTRRPSYSPHTIDTSVYRPDRGVEREHEHLLAVCWLGPKNPERKGLTDTIRALPILARSHKDIRLTVVGEKGESFSQVRDLASEVGVSDRVHFTGAVPRAEKLRLMQSCTLYVQPSQREGFGLAILEAMACGAPVITRRAGAVPEVGGAAVMYIDEPGPLGVAQGLLQLLADPAACQQLGRKAAERARTVFPYERRRDELAAVINSIR